jgi:hypothetical protein
MRKMSYVQFVDPPERPLAIIAVIRGSDAMRLQELNFKIQKILKQFPPALNKNKFIYGGLIQCAIIDFLKQHSDVVDYDRGHTVGAHYKHDARFMDTDISIKASANVGSAITLINKNGKQDHTVSDINLLVVYTRDEKIAVFPVGIMLPDYISDTGSKIEIVGRAYNALLKNSRYIIDLPPLSEEQKRIIAALPEIDQERELYEKYIL